jgi:putative pyruvate formate lyase activating enzyme
MAPLPPSVRALRDIVRACQLCPNRCGVDRAAGEVGRCGIGLTPRLASWGPHFGEEPVLVGAGGSGTIFFSGCSLHCVFCQNADISQQAAGEPAPPEALADLMIELQRRGCENVNVVTPTHVAHAVAEAVTRARVRGLEVPVVYNCGGYEPVQVLHLLAGLVDIYMPDFKYGDRAAGLRYSHAPDYPEVAEAALSEMSRQVGPLRVDGRGVATRGVLVRHLVLPGGLSDPRRVIEAVARAAPGAAVNIMAQYRPAHLAHRFPELLCRADAGEIRSLRASLARYGLLDVSR